MFPRRFRATVIQRMALWGGMLAFLLALLAMVEFIHQRKFAIAAANVDVLAAGLSAAADFNLTGEALAAAGRGLARVAAERASTGEGAMAAAAAAAIADIAAAPSAQAEREARERLEARRPELARALLSAVDHVRADLMSHLGANRQNRILIVLLAFFLIGQIVVLEYRWMVKPIARLSASLAAAAGAPALVRADAMRRDEIGALAQALTQHYALLRREESAAREEKNALSLRMARQEDFGRASLTFQNRIAEIVRRLEGNAGQMASASDHLAHLSRDADAGAAEAATSTQRASDHVDNVAGSIGDIATTIAEMSGEAARSSAVAVEAKDAVLAASRDAGDLIAAVRVIEQVVALIQDVANQTNLLSLNATIEAARVGESGRGFAVVASEVKQLATRTSLATEDVRAKLEAVTLASARIAERVRALVGSIDEIDSAAAAIAALMRKQDESSQLISSSTERTAADVRSVASRVETVAGMIGDAKQAADLVTRVSADLNRQAGDLRAIVQDFIRTTEGLAA